VGALFATAALQNDYKLTVYVRNPQKLGKEISSHANTTVIQGEMSDENKLHEAVKTGVDAVALLAGGDMSTKGTVSSSPHNQSILTTADPSCVLATPRRDQTPVPDSLRRRSETRPRSLDTII
jgi:putative NADH-flavin reductase